MKYPDKILDIKELAEKFHDIGRVKDKMFDPNLERSMTIHQGIEKMLFLY